MFTIQQKITENKQKIPLMLNQGNRMVIFCPYGEKNVMKETAGKVTKNSGATKTVSPILNSGATNKLPIGDSFMYKETSANEF